ncbi:MAG: 3-methyladenine DNA glycosylase/8-oxoguanine DNA glycosylase [Candidatus Aldehydirespiratoraceae bacterium]|jgi:3-methyladenine DNA glycosylase/8-oxoguanine DNA glycosylase
MTYRPAHEIDLRFVLLGAKTVRQRDGVNWWTTNTPIGEVVVAFRTGRGLVRADGWGPGTDWAFTQLPALLGANDDPSDFDIRHPKLAPLAANFSAVRIGATARWYEAVAISAIGQRVVTADAKASKEKLCRRYGKGLPTGPARTFPDPATLLTLTDADFHRVGIERSRARVLRVAAKYADRLERLDGVPGPDANEWLQRLPGIGPWTAALATAAAGGDPDAVPVGDLHIPRMITFALTGEANGTDETMLDALAPFAGHRQRVVRLVKLGGDGQPNHRPAPFRYDISQI